MKKKYVVPTMKAYSFAELIGKIEAGACSPVCSGGCFVKVW